MSFQKVPAGNGLQWITDSVNLIFKNPVPFLLMGLVIGVISMIPILGGLALLVLAPALYGGIMYAAREEQSGRKADFQQLFQAFKEEGKLPKMLMLCLPSVAAGIVLGVLGVVLLGGALLGAGAAASANSSSAFGAALGGGFLIFLLLALAVGLVVYALTFFATPRVMLEGAEPIEAMKDSARAVLANIGAVLVYCVVLLVAFCLAGIVLNFIPFIGPLLLMVALAPLVSVASYLAWRQVYRQDITQEVPPSAPPAPPSVEV
jgi:uncharacterized membrane protein